MKPIKKNLLISTFTFFVILFIAVNVGAQREMAFSNVNPSKNKKASIEEFRDAGFGLFIHWGPNSQIGNEISWPVNNASQEFRDKYFSLYKEFNPEKFTPERWAILARRAGMEYVVFTTKHHDGFCMYDSKYTDYDIMNTPYGKDITAEVAKAFRDNDISIGWYYSPPDWYYHYKTGVSGSYRKGGPLSKYNKPFGTMNLTLLEYELEQIKELLTNYGEIDMMWYDNLGIDTEPLKGRTWELKPKVFINRSEIPTPEQNIPQDPPVGPWETCMTMGEQWSYKPNDQYKSVEEIIHNLVKIRAMGGNYLLNVGPKPNGELPSPQVEILRKLGSWNAVNGEAIHGVREWSITNEDKVWFTRKKDANILYAVVLDGSDEKLTIESLYKKRRGGKVKVLNVKMLGTKENLDWQQDEEGLAIEVPAEKPSKYAYTLKIECEYLD